MLVTVVAIGSRGDVQPYVALGVGLREAGHQVRVATHDTFSHLVLDAGLQFAAIEGDPRQILETDEGRAWIESGRDPIRFVVRFLRLARPLVRRFLADSLTACEGSDAIVYSPLGFAGYHVAEARRLPSLLAALQPMTRTGAFPAVAVNQSPSPGRIYNLLTHVLAEQVSWQPFRRTVNDWRREALGLPPLPFLGPYAMANKLRHPVLYGFSPSVVPKPGDWGPWLHVTGYWFLDPPDRWRPPSALVDFLDEAPPPVYVGFGSMTARDPEALTELALRAASRARQRVVLSRGWAGLRDSDLPEWARVVDDVPHEWLFARMAAVVHHGGAGTTATGLRAGVPNVVVPFFGDQNFWAHRVRALGVGPAPVPRRKLSAERLAAAIGAAIADPSIRTKAATLGRRIEGEDGVARAVRVFARAVT